MGVTRRDFLKAAGLGVGALVLPEIPSFLRAPDEGSINTGLMARELLDEMELGELGKTRTEYTLVWPTPRVWVTYNSALAAAKLNGMKLSKGVNYSLIEMLQLEKDYQGNFDPSKGYISNIGLQKRPPFIVPLEAQGLSLTATCMARTLALTSASITEWNTHNEIDAFGRPYFEPKYELRGKESLAEIGTEATVYCADGPGPRADLRFTPRQEMTLRARVIDCTNGARLTGEEQENMPLEYAKALAPRFTRPIMLRFAFGYTEQISHQVEIQAQRWDEAGRIRPGFRRRVIGAGMEPNGEVVKASYDMYGEYFPLDLHH